MPTLCLRCTRSFVSVAWCGVPLALRFSWFPSLPLLSFLFIYLVIYSFGGWFILLHWASGVSVTGGLVAGLRFGRPVGVLPPRGVLQLQPSGP